MTNKLTTARDSADARFAAMGSDAHVIVVDAPPELVAAARIRIDDLEARWSRFRPDSEISRLNRSTGRPVLVSPDTFLAVSVAVEAWRSSAGRFDPTILPALIAAGYDGDFATRADRAALAPSGPDAAPPGPAPGCADIQLDPVVRAITLPPGVAIDLGGVGKGLAADIVATELVAAGAAGACVNLGGDLRVVGAAPHEDGWVIDVEELPDIRFGLTAGAIATSSTVKRRWTRDGSTFHHLIDPGRGRPLESGLAMITVVAGHAAAAEALTKSAFVAGRDAATTVVIDAGATGLLVTDAGELVALPGLERYLR